MNRTCLCLLLFLLLASCVPPRKHTAAPPPTSVDRSRLLERLRSRYEAARSFECEGTVLYRSETEKHFLHFTAVWSRPGLLRLDLDLNGPLGLGSGRMTVVQRGEIMEVLLPGETVPVIDTIGSKRFLELERCGFGLTDAAFLFAPYTGDPGLLREENVIAFGFDSRSGGERLTLRRPDGRREVLLIDPGTGAILERRVTLAAGEVLLLCEYRYPGIGAGLPAEEVESRIPREEIVLRVRFSEQNLNRPVPERLFDATVPLQ